MTTPEAFSANHTVDFRAPPPSPVAPGRRSSFTNDDVLTEYLHKSVKVPDLILPDRVFPRQKSVQNPEKLDFEKLEAIENESAKRILESIALVGCLEVINHGISRELIKLVLDLGGGIFEISPVKKRAVVRSPPERRYGFEEIHGEEEMNSSIKDESEEFVWCGEESMKLEMEGIWSSGYYSNFSEKMEKLSEQIEEIGVKILIFLFAKENGMSMEEGVGGKLCYIHKQYCRRDESENSLKYDVIRMLIRGSEFPHALCLHICSGSTEFHVYSKKGWVSFCPNQDSVVVTVGDKLQVIHFKILTC
ncbi:hypothetical protein ACJIZ3_025449 [Penstemon smallii]|uniref:Non-haem dioxygenase N-terminal domain-containing protein n=1 Tax=Penstemon smallii TaxID=265156 RepID=A0ABD3TXY9_9LAMI